MFCHHWLPSPQISHWYTLFSRPERVREDNEKGRLSSSGLTLPTGCCLLSPIVYLQAEYGSVLSITTLYRVEDSYQVPLAHSSPDWRNSAHSASSFVSCALAPKHCLVPLWTPSSLSVCFFTLSRRSPKLDTVLLVQFHNCTQRGQMTFSAFCLHTS